MLQYPHNCIRDYNDDLLYPDSYVRKYNAQNEKSIFQNEK